MSAPKTNLEKQKWRHRGPLIGIVVAVALAVGLLLWLLGHTLVVEPTVEEDQPAEVEGSTGIPAEGTFTDPVGSDETPQVIESEPEPNPDTNN